MSVLQRNKHPTLLIEKHNKKQYIKFCTVSSQIDFIQYMFDPWKQYFIRENRSKYVLSHHKLCEIAMQM